MWHIYVVSVAYVWELPSNLAPLQLTKVSEADGKGGGGRLIIHDVHACNFIAEPIMSYVEGGASTENSIATCGLCC